MRLTWVHPSWRDLVIEHVAESPQLRRAFITRAELPGILLTLSTEGGPAGSRRLPLLATDTDWDALGDATHRLCLVLAEPDLAKLMDALDHAHLADLDEYHASEMQGVCEVVVGTVHRRFAHDPTVLSARTLTAWYALVDRRERPPPSIAELADAYRARRPPQRFDWRDQTCLRVADNWLAIAGTLQVRDPAGLKALGFFEDVESLRATIGQPSEFALARWPLLASIVNRLADLGLASRPLTSDDTPAVPSVWDLIADPLGTEQLEASRINRILADL